MNFSEKVILITGASSGIGKELSLALSKENCKLVLLARRLNLLNDLVDNIKLFGKADVIAIKCDVGNKEDVKIAYNQVIETYSKIDITILNAGYAERVDIKEYDSKYAEVTFGANVFGIIYWVEQLLPTWISNRKGVIIGVSSLADNRGYSGSSFYSASKAAASVYLEGLRVELNKYNIKVITVKPGFVKTPMTDKNEFKMPLIIGPKEAAEIIIKGLKKNKKRINFPFLTYFGSVIISFMPNWLYEFLESKRNK